MSAQQQRNTDRGAATAAPGASGNGSTTDEQELWRNWDGKTPWPGSPGQTLIYDGGRFFPAFTLDNVNTGYYSDDSDFADNMAHFNLDDPPDDPWRQDYLEFIIAQRQCSSRRSAADRPPAACSRHNPCEDCIFHPGATATSVHWQCMDDARVELELQEYLLERPQDASPWVPPSPLSSRRRFPPPRLIFGDVAAAAPVSSATPCNSNRASPSSSIRSDPPSPIAATGQPASASPCPPSVPRPVFGPPRPPPVYEDLSD